MADAVTALIRKIESMWQCTPAQLLVPQPVSWTRRHLRLLVRVATLSDRAQAENLLQDVCASRTSGPQGLSKGLDKITTSDLSTALARLEKGGQALQRPENIANRESIARKPKPKTDENMQDADQEPPDTASPSTLNRHSADRDQSALPQSPQAQSMNTNAQDTSRNDLELRHDIPDGSHSQRTTSSPAPSLDANTQEEEDGGVRTRDALTPQEDHEAATDMERSSGSAERERSTGEDVSGTSREDRLPSSVKPRQEIIPESGRVQYAFSGFSDHIRAFKVDRSFIVKRVADICGEPRLTMNQIADAICNFDNPRIARAIGTLGLPFDLKTRKAVFEEIHQYCEKDEDFVISERLDGKIGCDSFYHLLYQQYLRQDPLIYALSVALRRDCEWQLLSVPTQLQIADIDLDIPLLVGFNITTESILSARVSISRIDNGFQRVMSTSFQYMSGRRPSFACSPTLDEVAYWNRECLPPTYDCNGISVIPQTTLNPPLIPYSNIGMAVLGYRSWESYGVQDELWKLFGPNLETAKKLVAEIRVAGLQRLREKAFS